MSLLFLLYVQSLEENILCSLQQEIPDSYDQSVVTLFTFLIRLELEGNIVSFCQHYNVSGFVAN